MKIPFVDLAQQSTNLIDDILPAIENVIHKASFILGAEVELFESEFAEFCDSRFAVGVANGTEALHLALRALEIGPGDEVITAANTFAATAYAILHAGATPVIADVDPLDYCLDTQAVADAITPRTKAIIPVHLYGQPARMNELSELADRHNLFVVEDACQAHGAKYHGRSVGSLGHLGCFSFYPGKNLGAFGDGGAVVTNDERLAEELRLLRNYGQRIKNRHDAMAFNSRLDTLQAAVLLVKLSKLPSWNEKRRHIADLYAEYLANTELVLPHVRDEASHVYHLYVVRHPQRDALMAHLNDRDVQCGIHYPIPIHRHRPFEQVRTVPAGVPVASQLAGEILSLPMYPEMTEEAVQYVAEAMGECVTENVTQ
ncbi:MAG: DegT/DnrJ/EryC1/StrS family aminotransferase [Planctomycetales bacterium]|nr:DegT/DnrJ/EryC1/StrS family aminotransferase [Planctomycetales bacterium]